MQIFKNNENRRALTISAAVMAPLILFGCSSNKPKPETVESIVDRAIIQSIRSFRKDESDRERTITYDVSGGPTTSRKVRLGGNITISDSNGKLGVSGELNISVNGEPMLVTFLERSYIVSGNNAGLLYRMDQVVSIPKEGQTYDKTEISACLYEALRSTAAFMKENQEEAAREVILSNPDNKTPRLGSTANSIFNNQCYNGAPYNVDLNFTSKIEYSNPTGLNPKAIVTEVKVDGKLATFGLPNGQLGELNANVTYSFSPDGDQKILQDKSVLTWNK